MTDVPHIPEGYHDTGEHAYKRRDLSSYKVFVFKDAYDWMNRKPDTMRPTNPMEWTKRHFHALQYFVPQNGTAQRDQSIQYEWDWPEANVFGGFDGFFSQGARILDLGAGHGQVVQEINEKYGNTDIQAIGIDARYPYDVPEVKKDLVTGDFRALPFQDNSFDRLLSVESFPAWMPRNKELIQRYFREITRVSKNGTIWRGTFPSHDDYPALKMEELIGYFCENGWEVVDERGFNFAARLRKEIGNQVNDLKAA